MFSETLLLVVIIQRDFLQMLHHKMLWSLILQINKQLGNGTLSGKRAFFTHDQALETDVTALI
jgi:hypothetical protein